ncbi:MAG: hypothetical protein O3C40_19500 [Planctomycetota bacterium]|nr:hypothetical protein [Planctomycetota bacterium]
MKSLCCHSLCFLVVLLANHAAAQDEAYGLVLRNERIVDGTGNPRSV